jgi:hypothetical protein
MQRPGFGYRSLTRVCRAQSLWQSRAEIDGVATEKDLSGTMDVPRDRRSSRKRSLVGSPVSECQTGRMKETGQIPCTRTQAKQAASERWIRSVDLSLSMNFRYLRDALVRHLLVEMVEVREPCHFFRAKNCP